MTFLKVIDIVRSLFYLLIVCTVFVIKYLHHLNREILLFCDEKKDAESIKFYRTFVNYHDLHFIAIFYGINLASSIDSASWCQFSEKFSIRKQTINDSTGINYNICKSELIQQYQVNKVKILPSIVMRWWLLYNSASILNM